MLLYLKGEESHLTSNYHPVQMGLTFMTWNAIYRKYAACTMCWLTNRPYISWNVKYKVLYVYYCRVVIVKFSNSDDNEPRNLNGFKMSNSMSCFKMSTWLCSTVCAQLYHAWTDAQPDANGKRQPVFPVAHRQLHNAVVCKANIHSNALHEWGNSNQGSVDYQWNTEDQDTVRHLRQCQHQRHWQGTNAVWCCNYFIWLSLKSLCFVLHWLKQNLNISCTSSSERYCYHSGLVNHLLFLWLL